MKKIPFYIFVFICIFAISDKVLVQIKKTNDHLCWQQVGPSRYHKWPDSLGGGASCDCLDGYEWDLLSLHCLKKGTRESLEEANKQIDELKKANIIRQLKYESENEVKKSNEQFVKIAEEESKQNSQIIGWIIVVFLIILYIGITLYGYTRPKNIEERRRTREIKRKIKEQERESNRIQKEEENKIKREEYLLKLKQKEEETRQEKEARMAEYQKLRKEIEAMPKYENWKNSVFLKNGARCEMCGEVKNLEIHHRQSFHSIIRAYQIKNIAQAFEANALWEIDNGSVLCKTCHAKMESSKYREINAK